MWRQKINKKRFFHYLLNEKFTIILASILLIIGVMGNIAVPLIIKEIFNVDKMNLSFLLKYLLLFFSIIIITGIVNYLYNYILYKASNNISIQMQQDLVNNIIDMNFWEFEKCDKSQVLNRFINDIRSVEQIVQTIFPSTVKSLFFVISSIVILFSMNYVLSIISIIIVTIYILAFSILNKKIIKRYRKNIILNDEMVESTQDIINGASDIKVWNVVKNIKNYYKGIQNKYYVSKLQYASIATFTDQTYNFIKVLGNVIVIVTGYYLFSINKITIGEIFAFILYLNNLYDPVIDLFDASNDYNKCITNIERIFEFKSNINNKNNVLNDDKTSINKIEFQHVSFAYDENIVLKDMNFILEKNKIYALIGKTGCGKSTLLNIIIGLYKPASGIIKINNQEVTFDEYKNIGKHIYAILQDSYIFNRTIKDNIETYSNGNIKTLLKQACLLELEDRLEEKVGRNGNSLSGGQKQRLLLTRIFDRKNDILILDESTSAMDANTQDIILRNIFKQYKDSIVIFCSHQQKILNYADYILKLDDKNIVCVNNAKEK